MNLSAAISIPPFKMSKRSLSCSTMAAAMQVILTLTFLLAVESLTGFCEDNQCYSVHQDMADFTAAKKVCQDLHGHLLTVRSNASNSAISSLLTDLKGDLWIGLQFFGNCPQSPSDLKGYKWITGQEEADFHNWDRDDAVCPTSELCVTVSTDDLKWRERSCTDKVDGFICEFVFDLSCQPLPHSQIQTYRTPYDFEGPDLKVLPMGSVAELDDGTQYICTDNWQKSPWTCEIFQGGCEQKCAVTNSKPVCTCSPGYLVDNRNGRSCISDPCKGSGCEQDCIPHNGSFTCLCDQGFSLDADGKSCKDTDDCADERICAGSHSVCVNTHGGFNCACKKGFEMLEDICVDINECAERPCEHKCINTPGSYNCSCYERHKVSDEDRHNCILHCPHQECPAFCEKSTEADGKQQRENCRCPDGFILDDNFCVDIDECEMYYCDQHCDNTFGGYTCSCGEGYELVDGYKCVGLPNESPRTTPSYSVVTPTVKDTAESPSAVTPSSFLGVGVVCALLALVLLVFHCLKRRREYSLISARKSTDLEQMTENYKPHFSEIQMY